MKKFVLALLAVILSQVGYSQVLEEVDFSPHPSLPRNTWVSGINNHGFICGYYDDLSGNKNGFVVNPNGRTITLTGIGIAPGFQHITVEGINDSNTVIINGTDASGNITVLKGYYNALIQDYTVVPVSGVGQPNVSKPYAINNKNVYTGWYPNTTQRWLWWLNDSNATSLAPWWSSRYYNGSAFVPTYAHGINDNNLICGYYIDGSMNYPLVYDPFLNNYDILPFANSMRLRDINNNNRVCGEYKQASGFYCGFVADYSTGSLSNFTSINSFFNTPNIQSILMGINDKNEWVGSYLHPVTNTWVGFIIRPDQDEYRLPDFSYAQDTWKINNNNVNLATDVFTNKFYGGFNYFQVDPFLWNGQPLVNSVISSIYPILLLPKSTSISWKGFATENFSSQSAIGGNMNFYELVQKPLLFTRYRNNYIAPFTGYCFGFSYTALLRKYRDSLFSAWYGLPLGSNISAITNDDTLAVLAIERAYNKQSDPRWSSRMFPINTSYWSGMYRMKYEFNRDAQQVNAQSVGIGLPNGGHNLLPYKIHTPQSFPFDLPAQAYDTLFVYDSSNPNDSTQMFVVHAPVTNNQGQNATNSSWPNMTQLRFQKIGIRDTVVSEFSNLKKTRALLDSQFQFSLKSNLHFEVKNASLDIMSYDGTTFNNNCSNILQDMTEELIGVPRYYLSDTHHVFSLKTMNYNDSLMLWSVNRDFLCFGISRKANPTETDYSSLGHRQMTYGNPDNVLKKLNAWFIEANELGTQGHTVVVKDLEMVQGDSILTENPEHFVYKITKISNGNTSYSLTTYTFSQDTAKQFQADSLLLQGNSSHTIQGFFGGNQSVIFIDQGLNGSVEDTVVLNQVPLSVSQQTLPLDTKILLYPVPANESVSVRLTEVPQGKYQLLLCSAEGRILDQQWLQTQQGTLQHRLSLHTLPAGMYFIFLRNEQGDVLGRKSFCKE